MYGFELIRFGKTFIFHTFKLQSLLSPLPLTFFARYFTNWIICHKVRNSIQNSTKDVTFCFFGCMVYSHISEGLARVYGFDWGKVIAPSIKASSISNCCIYFIFVPLFTLVLWIPKFDFHTYKLKSKYNNTNTIFPKLDNIVIFNINYIQL